MKLNKKNLLKKSIIPADTGTQTKSNPPASQKKKDKCTKSRKETPKQAPMSPVESPQGKLKRTGTRNVGALPKLCNPVAIAVVHRDHLEYLEKKCLSIVAGTISGEQFFHRIVQHCSQNKGNNFVLVSRPFKSTTMKVDGAPLVVRQVSTVLQIWLELGYNFSSLLRIIFFLP